MKEKNNKLPLFNQILDANNLNTTSNYYIDIDINKINNLNILNSIERIYGLETLKEVIAYYDEEKIAIKSISRYNTRGKLHGKTEGFYRNGKKHYELNYLNGKLHGKQFINWVNQRPFIEFNYFNGKPEGIQAEYSVSGTVQWKVFCCKSANDNKNNNKSQDQNSEVNLLCND
ncbi:MAG: toxin-antitoxin system YwqK family antitoxin [bacterium]